MTRILIANLLVRVLPMALIAGGVYLAVTSRSETTWRRRAGFLLIAVPAGVFVYIVAGIVAARIRGEGHFYSVPFGGYSVSNDTATVGSIVIWIAVVFFLLSGLLRPRQQ